MENRKILLTVLVMLLASALIAGTSLLAKALGTAALGPALTRFRSPQDVMYLPSPRFYSPPPSCPALHQTRDLAAFWLRLGGLIWRHLHVCRFGVDSAA